MRRATELRNGIWNVSGLLGSTVGGMLVSVLMVRGLSTDAYGVVSYYAWLASLLTTLGVLSAPTALTRFIAELGGKQRDDQARGLAHAVAWSLVSFNVLVGLAVAVVSVFLPHAIRPFVLAVAAVPALNALGRVLSSTLWGRENYVTTGWTLSLSAAIQLSLAIVAFSRGWGTLGYLVVLLVPQSIGPIVLLVASSSARREIRRARRAPLDSTITRRFLKFLVPTAMLTILDLIVVQRSEVYFLHSLSSLTQVGIYSLSFTMFSVFLGIGTAFLNPYYPSIAREAGAANWESARHKFKQATVTAILYAAPLFFGAASTLPYVIELLYGTKMAAAGPTATLLFVGLLPGVLLGVLSLTFNSINRPWSMLPVFVVTATINIGLAIVLVPRYGALGAALTNSFVQLASLGGGYVVAQRVFPVAFPWRDLIRLGLLAAAAAYAWPTLLLRFGTSPLMLAITMASAAALYITAVTVAGYGAILLDRGSSRRTTIAHLVGLRELPREPDKVGISGVVRATLELAAAQASRGHDVRVVAVGASHWRAEWRSVRLESLRPAGARLMGQRFGAIELRAHLAYVIYSVRHRIDFIHTHLYSYTRGLRARARYIHFHGDPFIQVYTGANPAMTDRDFSVIGRYSDAQLAVSQFIADQLARGMRNVPRHRIETVRHGIDLARFDVERRREFRAASRAEWGLGENAVVIGFAGAIAPEKGIMELARAFSRLARLRPEAVLVIAGSSDLWRASFSTNTLHRTFEQRVRAELGDAQSRGQVRYLGTVASADMPKFHGSCDLLAVPSIVAESFGLVALEALAMGTPVVASRIGGLIELVQPDCGILVEPAEVPAWVDALLTVVTDRGLREKLGGAAVSTARGYGWDRTANQLEMLYSDANPNRAGPRPTSGRVGPPNHRAVQEERL